MKTHDRLLLGIVLGGACLGGCQVDYEVDPNFYDNNPSGGASTGGNKGLGGDTASGGNSSGSGGESSSSGGTASLDACGSGFVCVPQAPADWSGPVAVGRGSFGATLSCAGTGHATEVFSLASDPDEGNASCECTCSDPASMTCASSLVLDRWTSELSCASTFPSSSYTLNKDQCLSVPASGYYTARRPAYSSGNCSPQPTIDIATPSFAGQILACVGDEQVPSGCETEHACLPQLKAPLNQFCVYRDGDHACPAQIFTERSLHYSSATDNRECTTCSCGGATGQCTTSVSTDSSTSCAVAFSYGAIANGGSCYQFSEAGNMGVSWTAPVATGTCPASGGTLTGNVDFNGTTTVCCAP